MPFRKEKEEKMESTGNQQKGKTRKARKLGKKKNTDKKTGIFSPFLFH